MNWLFNCTIWVDYSIYLFYLLYRTAEEKEDWIQARTTHACSHTYILYIHLRTCEHTHCLSCAHAACAFGRTALLENGISKDFLPTLIQCVCELCSLIKPLIIAHLAHYSRAKLIKTFCRLEEGVGGFMCVSGPYVSKREGQFRKAKGNDF